MDKTVRIWDSRARPDRACMVTVSSAHSSDVNVIDWNASEPFLASGGDDGFLKVWDLRQVQSDSPEPVAAFGHHRGPVTSVEWHRSDATVLASSGADDQVNEFYTKIIRNIIYFFKGIFLSGGKNCCSIFV